MIRSGRHLNRFESQFLHDFVRLGDRAYNQNDNFAPSAVQMSMSRRSIVSARGTVFVVDFSDKSLAL